MKRKILSMCLVACMAAGVAGGTVSADSGDGEYPVIRINYASLAEMADEGLVEEEINKIMREKAGAEIDLIPIEGGNYQTRMNLLLTGGDDSLDLFTSFWYTSTSNLVANGQVISLDELLESSGQGILEKYDGFEDYLNCGKVGEALYGIPSMYAWCSEDFYVVKQEISDDAGIDWDNVQDLDTLTEAMIVMKEKNPDSYFIPGSTQTYFIPKDIDYFGDTDFLGVLTDPTNSTTVENYYESEYFLNLLEHVKKWKEHNLISPDPLSNSNATLVNLQYGIVDGTTGWSWDAKSNIAYIEVQKNMDLTGGAITEPMVTTGDVSNYMWHISAFCKDPEAAMRVLNVMFTDPDVANMLGNGLEGRNYVMNEDGQMELPEGVASSADLGWQIGSNGVWPNSTLCKTWNYESKDTFEKMIEKNSTASKSLALGFQFDSTAVNDEITACKNVVAQYYLPLMYGEEDIDSALPVFQQALKDAGIEKIIAEKQSQLDQWLSTREETK